MKRLGKLCRSLRPSVLSRTGAPAAMEEMNLDEGGDDATSPLITTPLSSEVVVLSLVMTLVMLVKILVEVMVAVRVRRVGMRARITIVGVSGNTDTESGESD